MHTFYHHNENHFSLFFWVGLLFCYFINPYFILWTVKYKRITYIIMLLLCTHSILFFDFPIHSMHSQHLVTSFHKVWCLNLFHTCPFFFRFCACSVFGHVLLFFCTCVSYLVLFIHAINVTCCCACLMYCSLGMFRVFMLFGHNHLKTSKDHGMPSSFPAPKTLTHPHLDKFIHTN